MAEAADSGLVAKRWAAALAVALGGACGTLVRAWAGRTWKAADGALPATTLAVNLVGALLLGLLLGRLALSPDRGWRRAARLGVGTGFMGGLTTYSTLLLESTTHFGQAGPAAAYLVGSLIGGLVLACLGLWLAGRSGKRAAA